MYDEPEDECWREYRVRVTPRYLAGSPGDGEAGFAPVAHWPHHSFDYGPCQLMVTSPDHRIKIGWFGDNVDLWKITAAEDAVSPPKWQATFNHCFPPEIVAGLTSALAGDWDPEIERFLARPSMSWSTGVQPLLDAAWARDVHAERGTVPVLAPDEHAGALIDSRSRGPESPGVTLWAGPPGWATRAEAAFTVDTPSHLVAATAAAMIDPSPAVRERHMLHQDVERLVRLEPVEAETQSASRAPTPLDAKHAAVVAAVHRAAHSQPAGKRARAARTRTTQAQAQAGPRAAERQSGPRATARSAARPRR